MTWLIQDKFDKEKIIANGNKFLVANGYVGYRGTLDEFGKNECVGLTLNGFYDQVGEKWREPVNAPNPLYVSIGIDGIELSLQTKEPITHSQELNMQEASHSRLTTFELEGEIYKLESTRFVSAVNHNILGCQYRVSSSIDKKITVITGIDGDVWDINGPHLNSFEFKSDAAKIELLALTTEGKKIAVGQKLKMNKAYISHKLIQNTQQMYHEYTIEVKAGVPLEIEILGMIYHQNETLDPKQALQKAMSKNDEEGMDYSKELALHQEEWQSRWEYSDVQIEGDREGQIALRYSIYHLLSIAPHFSAEVSIPARGLSAQTYKGAVFWDTEIFMVPFFLHTKPEIAKNLLMYRVNTLVGAKKKAKEYGFEGAFYAWESQEEGKDATSDYNIVDVFTGRPMRTYFRDKQIHISGDIVQAFWNYYESTDDIEFLLLGGAEVILECAKFYYSYSYYKPTKKRYELIDVIGPDEYHERVANNAFTNKIASETILTAFKVIKTLEKNHSEFIIDLLRRLELSECKEQYVRFLAELYVVEPDVENYLIEQFTGYFDLENTTVEKVSSRIQNPKEYWGGAYGVASDTQIIKQADVIAMLYLFKHDYSEDILKANWLYYEPRTEHGSSLSACLYALVACEFNNQDWAYPYFMKTATVDLTGDTKQYAGEIYIGGTHPAANGGAWLVAVKGFSGLEIRNDQLHVNTRLPQKWQSMTYKTIFKGERYLVNVTKEGGEITKIQ